MINKIVTSLEVSRKLKDWGIVQKSIFYWCYCYTLDVSPLGWAWELIYNPGIKHNNWEYISAWTVTELGAMMDAVGINPNPNIAWGAIPNQIADGDYTIDEINQNLLSWRANDKG